VAGRRPARAQRLRYRYHFTDFVSGTPLATLPLQDASLSEVLSGASDGSGVVSLTDPAVRRHDPFRATVPRRTICWAERIVLDPQNRVVSSTYPWAGVVMRRERSRSSRSLALSMVTIPGYFARRIVRNQTHVGVDKFSIFRAILDDAIAWPYILTSSRPTPGELDPPAPLDGMPYLAPGRYDFADYGVGLPLSGVTADRTYLESDLRTALEEFRSLAGSGDGFDWRMYPVRVGDAPGVTGRFRMELALGYPRLGRIAPGDLVWSDDENDADAGQLLDYKITEDGAGVNNRLIALGEGSGPTQLRTEVWAGSVGRDEWGYGYPLWEASVRGSTSELRTQAYLDASARGAMIAGLASEVTLSGVTVRGDLMPTLDRWNVGDDGTFRIGAATTGTPTTIVGQIVARTIEPAQPGRPERVTLDLQGATA